MNKKNLLYDIRAIASVILGFFFIWLGGDVIKMSIGAIFLIIIGFFIAYLGCVSHGFNPEIWRWKFWGKEDEKEDDNKMTILKITGLRIFRRRE